MIKIKLDIDGNKVLRLIDDDDEISWDALLEEFIICLRGSGYNLPVLLAEELKDFIDSRNNI